jgi:hypothetical protein
MATTEQSTRADVVHGFVDGDYPASRTLADALATIDGVTRRAAENLASEYFTLRDIVNHPPAHVLETDYVGWETLDAIAHTHFLKTMEFLEREFASWSLDEQEGTTFRFRHRYGQEIEFDRVEGGWHVDLHDPAWDGKTRWVTDSEARRRQPGVGSGHRARQSASLEDTVESAREEMTRIANYTKTQEESIQQQSQQSSFASDDAPGQFDLELNNLDGAEHDERAVEWAAHEIFPALDNDPHPKPVTGWTVKVTRDTDSVSYEAVASPCRGDATWRTYTLVLTSDRAEALYNALEFMRLVTETPNGWTPTVRGSLEKHRWLSWDGQTEIAIWQYDRNLHDPHREFHITRQDNPLASPGQRGERKDISDERLTLSEAYDEVIKVLESIDGYHDISEEVRKQFE